MNETLNGKWRFVGAEKLHNSAWLDSPHFVENLIWEFTPEHDGVTKFIGTITEHSPCGAKTKLPYIFCATESTLNIEIYTEKERNNNIDIFPNIDKYVVTYASIEPPLTIKLTTTDDCDDTPRNFRYTLQKV